MEKLITKSVMENAFKLLDKALTKPVELILGGGGCMILAHNYPLATSDVDALPKQISFSELDPIVKEIAIKLNLPPDWLNPYFSSFTHVLPPDYQKRVKTVFQGRHLVVQGLGREEMLLMKCFAHRPKDLSHARALVKAGADLQMVEALIEKHKSKGIPMASEALDFLDDLIGEME